MKSSKAVFLFAAVCVSTAAWAQDKVWRCGNEYTNNASDAQKRGCKVIEGGNVTVVQGQRPASSTPAKAGTAARAGAGSPKNDSPEQKARDSDARVVLESELKKAQTRQTELLKEYNNGEPEKQGSESRNYQKYLDRVAGMKSELARNESDIAGLQREIDRLPANR